MKYDTSFTLLLFLMALFSCDSTKSSQHAASTASKIEPHPHGPYFENYELIDQSFGTKTRVSLNDDKRIMKTNSLPNHQTGSFPNAGNPNRISAQEKTYEFPVKPVYTGEARWIREPGIALNGIKFEPQTAEVVRCESGENYRVEAMQELINLGLDFNHAHVQPTGAYHYHGTPTSLIELFDQGKDMVHIGFAHDGFPIYYSKSGAYTSSFRLVDQKRTGTDCTYSNPHTNMDVSLDNTEADGTYGSDWEYVEGLGDLDACNGIELDGQYLYLVTDEFPYVGRCLMGEFVQQGGPPPGPGRGGHPGPPPHHHGRH
ncbi:MAG: YHYH protein [Bacteroidota bacterium]